MDTNKRSAIPIVGLVLVIVAVMIYSFGVMNHAGDNNPTMRAGGLLIAAANLVFWLVKFYQSVTPGGRAVCVAVIFVTLLGINPPALLSILWVTTVLIGSSAIAAAVYSLIEC